MKARVIALYLPQFHPVPENDKWWGTGFTEWRNVGKARPLFRGHYQPHIPADLGYYDLRVPETRRAQADMAKQYGVEGFMYWHYWFGHGKRLLERPFEEVVKSGEPDFPFCLAWANESWRGLSHGLTNRSTLIEQCYPGDEDYIAHFNALLPAFQDHRYITVDQKPLFMVYKPHLLPDPGHFVALWQKLAKANNLPGIYFVAHHQSRREHGFKSEEESLREMLGYGFDAVNFVRLTAYQEQQTIWGKIKSRLNKMILGLPQAYPYRTVKEYFSKDIDKHEKAIPSLIPNWDHTPRSGKEGLVFTHSTPKLFAKHIQDVMEKVIEKPSEHRLVFVKSWNEWAEGNYLEPDLRWGHEYLEVLEKELK